MSRSAERRKRQENRAQRRSPGSEGEELRDKLDRLGKRTRAQLEGSSRRGFADLAQLPQQLFAEVESSLGPVQAQPQVREAIGKMTEVMAAAAAMTPLNSAELEGRKQWVPEDLKDHSEVATRDRQDEQLHRERMEMIWRATGGSGGNRELRRLLERRRLERAGGAGGPEGEDKRGRKGEGEGAEGGRGGMTELLADLGLTGLARGGAAAGAAIQGSLDELLKAAEQALGKRGGKGAEAGTEAGAEAGTDAGHEAAHHDENRDGDDESREAAAENLEEASDEADEAAQPEGALAADAEADAEADAASGAAGELRTADGGLARGDFHGGFGGGALQLGAAGFSVQGGPGSMQLGPEGLSASLTSPLGSMKIGPRGASFDLAAGSGSLSVGANGFSLGVQTPAGSITAGRQGLAMTLPNGALQLGPDGASGQLDGVGSFRAAVEPTGPNGAPVQADGFGGAFKAAVEPTTHGAPVQADGFGGAFKAAVEPTTNGAPVQADGFGGAFKAAVQPGGLGDSLRDAAQSLGGAVGAAVQTLGGADADHKPLPAPTTQHPPVQIAIDPALAPEPSAKPLLGAARDKQATPVGGKALPEPKHVDPTAEGAAKHGATTRDLKPGAAPGAAPTSTSNHGAASSSNAGAAPSSAKAKPAAGGFSAAVIADSSTSEGKPTLPAAPQPTAARAALERTTEEHRTVGKDGSATTPPASEAPRPPTGERKATITTPQRPAPAAQAPVQLPVVPLTPVSRPTSGPVTQPDLQLTGRGDTPPTPSVTSLADAPATMPTQPAPPVSAPAAQAPAATPRTPTAAPTPAALPRPAARPAAPPAAGAATSAISVRKPGELGAPASSTPDLDVTHAALPAAGPRIAVPLTSTPIAAHPQHPVPEVTAARDQSATPDVPAGTPKAPDIKTPPPVGAGIPEPSQALQPTVSLGGDRDHAAQQLDAEARSQRKVPVAADAQRRVEIAPLGPERERQVPTIEVPARTQLTATTKRQTGAIDAAGDHGTQAAQQRGTQQQHHLQAGAAELRGELARRPPPAVIAATAPATTAPALQQSRALVAQQVSATAANRPPPNLAVSPAVAQASAGAAFGALDTSAIAGLDAPRPMPEIDPQAAQATSAELESEHAQNRAQLAALRDLKPPQLQMQPRQIADDEIDPEAGAPSGVDPSAPSGAGGTKPAQSGPRPRSRAAAIADIEAAMLKGAQEQTPAQLSAAGASLASEYEAQADTAFRQNQAGLAAADQQAQAQRAQLTSQPPPVNAAQVSAEAAQLWDAGQQQAAAASADMTQQVSASQETARAGVAAAQATQQASVAAAQSAQQADNAAAQAAFQSDHQAAQTGFQQQDQQAQQAQAQQQQQAQAQAQQRQAQAQAQNQAQQAQAQAQHAADSAAAESGHQADVAAANADSQREQQRLQADGDQQVAKQQADLQKQTADLNNRGTQQVNQITQDGEQRYQQRVAEGQREADARKAQGEREAAAKKAEADSQKGGGGGILGKALDWVKARVGELLEAAKSILEAARQAVVAILEAARAAAMAILDAARKAAMDALNAVKQLIQGAIQAVASAIRGIISAVANLVRAAIQALATALQTLVRALTTLLTTLVQAFQRAVNMLLDALVAAVSLINEDLGKQLQQATQKYRDAFNNACNQLQTKIQQAGQALEQGIQRAADRAIAVVDAAEQTLNNAVTAVEQTLHNAVEAAYQKGVELVNRAYEAAKTAVNQVFDAAVAATNLYFDTLKKGLDGVKAFVDFAIDKAKQAVKDLGALVSKWASAITDLLPSSALKFFSDVWNSGWRNAVIIGLATIVAVAVTIGTGGVGGPIAAVLLASLIGGTLAGGATLAGDALARQATVTMAERGEGIYVPGVGMLKVGPDGQPDLSGVPPDQREQAMKNMQWALSNFDQSTLQAGPDGRVNGTAKSHEEIGQMSMDEGVIAFAEGAVSAGLAAVGGLGGTAIANRLVGKMVVDSTIKQAVKHAAVSALVEAPINVLSSGSTQAVRSGLETIRDGGSWADARKAATDAFTAGVMDPATWGSSILAVPGAAAGARVTKSAMSPLFKQASETVIEGGTELVGGGTAAASAEYFKALASGASHEEALNKARQTFTDNFSLENILVTGGLTVGGKVIEGGVERVSGGGGDGGGVDMPVIPRGGDSGSDSGSGSGSGPASGSNSGSSSGSGTNSNSGSGTTRPVSSGGSDRPDLVDTRAPGGTTRPGDPSAGNHSPGRPAQSPRPNDTTTRPGGTTARPGDTTRPGGTTTRPGDGPSRPAAPADPTKRPTRPGDTTPDGYDAHDTPDAADGSTNDNADVPPAVGAVRGSDVYPVNTRRNDAGEEVPIFLNREKANRGLRAISTGGRTFAGGTVSDVDVSDGTTAGGHRAPRATMNLDLPAQNGMPATRVEVEVRFLPPGELSSTSAHGEDVGPARFTLTQDSTGNWRASVEIDQRSRPEDVQFILGHELTEIGALVNDNPGGVPAGGFGDQMEAGVMRDGTDAAQPTAHDRAAAHELAALANEINRLTAAGAAPARVQAQQRVLDAAIDAAGLTREGNVDAKLRLLAEAGAPPELIHQVQHAEATRVRDATVGPNSNLSASAVQHLMYPAAPTGGFHNGVSGGHVTSRLLELGGPDTPFAFHEVSSATVAGTTVRQYEQYKWNGSGPKPMPGSGAAPGEPNFNPADWAKASTPKTTTDDIAPYLQEVDAALDAWYATNGTAIPNDRKFVQVSPSGILIEGYFDPTPGPDGRPVVRTAYMDANWLAGQAATQSTGAGDQPASSTSPTPAPTTPTNSGGATNRTDVDADADTDTDTTRADTAGGDDNNGGDGNGDKRTGFGDDDDPGDMSGPTGSRPPRDPNDLDSGGGAQRPRPEDTADPRTDTTRADRSDDTRTDTTRTDRTDDVDTTRTDRTDDVDTTPARREPQVPDAPLAHFDATVEQLAHGMVGRDLTEADLAFLEQNGYAAGPIIRGKHDFVMRVFTPTREGVPPIVSFRGTVPSRINTLIADADPAGIGMYQFTPNQELIAHWMNLASQHGPIVVAGHSLGGALSQITASHFPDLVRDVITFQAPAVTRATADRIRQYNEQNPDRAITSTHHRVLGDLVPRGGEALTPGTLHQYSMHGGSVLANNILSRHLASPLSQRERDLNGHQLPTQSDNPDITFSYDGAISTDADTLPGGPTETARRTLGTLLFGAAGAIAFTARLPGGAWRLSGAALKRVRDVVVRMLPGRGGDAQNQLPPGDGPDGGDGPEPGQLPPGSDPTGPVGPRGPQGPRNLDGGDGAQRQPATDDPFLSAMHGDPRRINEGDADRAVDPVRDSADDERAIREVGAALDEAAADTTATPARREPQVPDAPLAHFDATVEQLAHGMVGRDLTEADLAFLEQNGYAAGPIIRGKHDFVMRVFTPTREGVPPIVSFRGTVPSKIQTLIADADPSGIGMYQFTPNQELIAHWMNLASQHGPIVVAGHSLGGALSQITASHFPDLVRDVMTFQAPGVTRETADRLRQYNEQHPDRAITSTHHRVAGDLVPLGGETLTPGTLHTYTMQGGGFLSNNVLSRHLASPLSQRERDGNGHLLPTQSANPDITFSYDGAISTDEDTRPGGPTETARRTLGTLLFGTAGALAFTARLPGGAWKLTGATLKRVRALVSRMFHRGHADPGAGLDGPETGQRQLPPGGPGGDDSFLAAMNGDPQRLAPAEDAADGDAAREVAAALDDAARGEPQVPDAPLAHFDATVEQLAHGMVGRDLTEADLAFLEQNGYAAGPIVRGKRDFVMRVFLPTREGVPPIVSFRGTVPSKIQTLIADADPSGIGMYQWNANRDLIAHWMNLASAHGKILVAGHSLGGALSQITASRFPELVGSVMTFQAPGVTRETADRIRQYNDENPDAAIESTHHRVLGDLVPRGGETLTPGTLHDYSMTGGNVLQNNVLSRHLASPLSQRERDENGHRLPTQNANEAIGFTYDGARSTDDDTVPGGPTEMARKVLGSAIFGTGGAIRRLRQMVGGVVSRVRDRLRGRNDEANRDSEGDATTTNRVDDGVTEADAAEAASMLARLERAEHAARDLSAVADAELLAAGGHINPADPRAAVRDAIAVEVFRYGPLLNSNAAIVAAATARLERQRLERQTRRASLSTMTDHGQDAGGSDPFIQNMAGRIEPPPGDAPGAQPTQQRPS